MSATPSREFLTCRVHDQWLGIPIGLVQEVLLPQHLAVVPLAPEGVAGLLNLRGQIVTAMDLRTRLDLPGASRLSEAMHVVVRHDGELFSLLVDEVGDVLAIEGARMERVPPTLDPGLRAPSSGLVRRHRDLLLVLDVSALLTIDAPCER